MSVATTLEKPRSTGNSKPTERMSQEEIFSIVHGVEYNTEIVLTVQDGKKEKKLRLRTGTKNGGAGIYLSDSKSLSDPDGTGFVYDYELPVLRIDVTPSKK